MLFQGNAQAQQQLPGIGLGGVTVQFRELNLQLGDAHAVVFAHLREIVDGVFLLLDLPQLVMAHDHRVDRREVLKGELVLAQDAHALIGIHVHVASRWLNLATEDFHEGGLAGAIGADQTVAVAIAEAQGNILEKRLGTKLDGDIGGSNQSIVRSLQMSVAGESHCGIAAVVALQALLRLRRA